MFDTKRKNVWLDSIKCIYGRNVPCFIFDRERWIGTELFCFLRLKTFYLKFGSGDLLQETSRYVDVNDYERKVGDGPGIWCNTGKYPMKSRWGKWTTEGETTRLYPRTHKRKGNPRRKKFVSSFKSQSITYENHTSLRRLETLVSLLTLPKRERNFTNGDQSPLPGLLLLSRVRNS